MDEGVKWKNTTVHQKAERKKATKEFNFVPTPMFPFQGLYLNVGKQNSEKSILYYHGPSKTTPQIFPFTLEKVTHYFFPPYTWGWLTPQNQVKTTQKLPKTWFQFQVPKLNLNQQKIIWIFFPSTLETRDSCKNRAVRVTWGSWLLAYAGILGEVRKLAKESVYAASKRKWQKWNPNQLMLSKHLLWCSIANVYSRELKTGVQTDTCTRMFTVALFT